MYQRTQAGEEVFDWEKRRVLWERVGMGALMRGATVSLLEQDWSTWS